MGQNTRRTKIDERKRLYFIMVLEIEKQMRRRWKRSKKIREEEEEEKKNQKSN